MRAALLAPILPRVMEEGESKKAALVLMKNSHFDRTLRCNPTNFSLPNRCQIRNKYYGGIQIFSAGETCKNMKDKLGFAKRISTSEYFGPKVFER